jgi:hypothetical protein
VDFGGGCRRQNLVDQRVRVYADYQGAGLGSGQPVTVLDPDLQIVNRLDQSM